MRPTSLRLRSAALDPRPSAALRSRLFIAALPLLLAGCGGVTAPPKATVEIPAPNPMSISAGTDAAAASSATVPLSGGTLSATGADGTVYTLTIPADSLLEETVVTMTPLSDIAGAPVTGRALGIRLEPHGLRLYREATLDIAPADGVAFSAIGFAAGADGSDFHLVPPIAEGDGTSVSFHLMHFSDHGGFTGSEVDPIVITDSPGDFMPMDWEAQLAQMMAELLAKEREAQLAGEEGDPELNEKIEAIVNTFYIKVIAPMLPRIMTECSYAEANVSKVLSWARTVMLLGMDEAFSREVQKVMDAVVAGADNCWQEAIEPCVDQASSNFVRVVQLARMNQLLGGSPDVYDPWREDIQCDGTCEWLDDVTALNLEYSFSWQQAGSDEYGSGDVDRSWNAQAALPLNQNYDTTRGFRADTASDHPVTASYQVDDVYTSEFGSRTTTSIGEVNRVALSVTFDTSTCTYDASFHLEGRAVTEDEQGTPTEHNLTVGTANIKDHSAVSGSLGGTASLPHQQEASDGSSYFSNGWDDAAHVLIQSGLGTANVSWSLVPVMGP